MIDPYWEAWPIEIGTFGARCCSRLLRLGLAGLPQLPASWQPYHPVITWPQRLGRYDEIQFINISIKHTESTIFQRYMTSSTSFHFLSKDRGISFPLSYELHGHGNVQLLLIMGNSVWDCWIIRDNKILTTLTPNQYHTAYPWPPLWLSILNIYEIIGMGATGTAWQLTVAGLLSANPSLQICTYDNRGI